MFSVLEDELAGSLLLTENGGWRKDSSDALSGGQCQGCFVLVFIIALPNVVQVLYRED